jgi:hypothetical protein
MNGDGFELIVTSISESEVRFEELQHAVAKEIKLRSRAQEDVPQKVFSGLEIRLGNILGPYSETENRHET